MSDRKTKLQPTRKASRDLKEFARRAREINDKLAAQGRHFGDSAEIIRADRDSRT